jgi:hypothetical protein
MAHFIGYLSGSRAERSCLGTKASGITAHAEGWNIGGRVDVSHDTATGRAVVVFTLTHGSNATDPAVPVAAFTFNESGQIVPLPDKARG